MDLDLTETQQAVQKTARLCRARHQSRSRPSSIATSAFPKEIPKELADLGLMGVNIPASLGGAEAGVVAYSLAMMEIARACASTAVTMAVTNMVAEVIARFGTEGQKEKHVPKLTSGEYVAGAFALSEPEAGSDPGGMRTVAEPTSDGWILRGQKQWITSGSTPGAMVVWARHRPGRGRKASAAALVEGDRPGVKPGKHEDKLGLRASNTVPARRSTTSKLDKDARLGVENEGFKIAMMALDGGRIGIASQAIGIATAALEEADELRQRAEAVRSADRATTGAFNGSSPTPRPSSTPRRLLALRAAQMKESGKPFSREAAMAKLFASEKANVICGRNVQIHGGYGYVRDFPAERHLRDVRVTTIYEAHERGPADGDRPRLGPELCGRAARASSRGR